MRLLTKEEYEATFCAPMVNVTASAEEIVDLWAYADPIIEAEYHNCTAWKWGIDHIYETPDGRYQHVGIPAPKNDTYLVIVIDKPNLRIIGHHIIDLRSMYVRG